MCTYMAACDALLCDVNKEILVIHILSGGNTETFLDVTFIGLD